MTPKIGLRESLFSLVFNTEAVLPPEIVFSTPRVKNFDEEAFQVELRAELDQVSKTRATAHLRMLMYKKAMAKTYDWDVRLEGIQLRDLVLRKAEISDPTWSWGKLAPN